MIEKESGLIIQRLSETLQEAVDFARRSGMEAGKTARWEQTVREAQLFLKGGMCGGCGRNLNECISLPCTYRETVAAD